MSVIGAITVLVVFVVCVLYKEEVLLSACFEIFVTRVAVCLF